MIYLRSFKLFESYYDTLDDVQNLISEVEDRLDCDFERNRIEYDKISFIFTFSQSKFNIDDEIFKTTISWFIDSIKRLDKIIIQNKVFSPDFGTFYKDEFTNGFKPKGFVINISGSFTEIFTNLIRDYDIDPQSIKKEIKKFSSDKFINELFKLYCGRLHRDIDFTMLEVFRTGNNDLLSPIKFGDVQLPHNLSEQFKIDITPIFLEKVYKNSGLVFRISLSSKYQFNMVTREDRLRGESIANETDKKLKELGLELTWKDIFVKSENYNNW
jgi:hypothetical protein